MAFFSLLSKCCGLFLRIHPDAGQAPPLPCWPQVRSPSSLVWPPLPAPQCTSPPDSPCSHVDHSLSCLQVQFPCSPAQNTKPAPHRSVPVTQRPALRCQRWCPSQCAAAANTHLSGVDRGALVTLRTVLCSLPGERSLCPTPAFGPPSPSTRTPPASHTTQRAPNRRSESGW